MRQPDFSLRKSMPSGGSGAPRRARGRAVLRYVVFALGLLGLTAVLESVGALSGLWWHKALELPLVLYLYLLFSQLYRPGPVGAVLAAVPILLSYALMDVYFLLFGRVFRLSELREVPELVQVLPWYVSAALIGGFLVVSAVLLFSLRPRRPVRLALAALPLVTLVSLLAMRPDWFLGGFAAASNGVVEWSDFENVRWNGRLTTVLYAEAKRRDAVRKLQALDESPGHDEAFEAIVSALERGLEPRNVHVLVLEGFVDPTRMENLRLDRDVVHADFRKFLRGGRGGLSVSPVFGGYTAQAEFEILCGVPALQELGTIEFNLFSGTPVHCLPEVMNRLGYRTLFTQGFKPNFFNMAVAFPALGFAEGYFAGEYAPRSNSYLSTGDVAFEEFMFDTTLLDQNLDFIQRHFDASPDQPLLNYVLTIYGHYPYRIDKTLRPDVVTANEPFGSDEELMIVLNQHYYRSKAIAGYLERLVAMDPDALIVMVSDHLPPLKGGRDTYARLGYLAGEEGADKRTLLAVLDRGRPVPVGTLHQYDIPDLIYRLLSNGKYCDSGLCAELSPEQLRERYLQLMARAVKSSR
jgi:phosphoglycerol transferase MdoB-like AlkP superfamily enzyme